MKISYAITVCNELEEIQNLLNFLLEHKRIQDEIVVLMDIVKANDELVSTLRHYEMHNMDHMVVWSGEFQGHFADWKNKLNSYCTGDYIVNIDADECPHPDLIKDLPAILENNPEVDVFLVPRVNTVEGITQEHIDKWGWFVNQDGWVNFPDFQWRIYKNKPEIVWTNKVHEVLTGYKDFTYLPQDETYAFMHPKTIDRQEKQNKYYDTL